MTRQPALVPIACQEGFCGSPVDPVWPLPFLWPFGSA
jgi:hypothetical protein